MSSAGLEETRTVPFLDLGSMTEEVANEVLAGWSELLASGAFIGGDAVTRFEDEFAAFCGCQYAVGVANGTDALHLALRALRIGLGDEVIVPANTFVATVEAILLAGAEPRFADVDPQTLLMTPATMAAAWTPRCRAVAVVHLFGQMAEMGPLASAASQLGLVIVEDAAQAQGASWGGDVAGSSAPLVASASIRARTSAPSVMRERSSPTIVRSPTGSGACATMGGSPGRTTNTASWA